MDSPFQKIHLCFMRAIEYDDLDERGRYMEQCRQDYPDLYEHLQAMVLDYELQQKSNDSEEVETFPNAQLFGEKLEVIKLLGEGGFGSVYLTRQAGSLQRLVALKVIKRGLETEEIISRFRLEQGALAIMNHPGIAKVLAAGTTGDGRPFFVMEYVDGLPITEYCDRCRLNFKERLLLFNECCNAVSHAHQKGVVHRDLKPSNILVATEDSNPLLKVIDFGIAKALVPGLIKNAVQTKDFQLVGSPLFMSPEQAGALEYSIDTRTDVYSLGALLYQLVAGVPTYDGDRLQNIGFMAALECVRTEKVPNILVRFSSLDPTQQVDCSANHKVSLTEHKRNLGGEISWIINKAIEKNPDDRYSSVLELSQDIKNLLENRPVNAKKPGKIYLTKKFVQRNRLGVSIGATVTLSLVLSFLFALIQLSRARDAEDLADTRLTAITDANKFVIDTLGQLLSTRERLQQLVYVGDTGLAASEEANGDISAAIQLLDNQLPSIDEDPRDHRGFEWYFLHQLINLKRKVLHQSLQGFSYVDFLPDNQLILTGNYNGTISILRADSGELVDQLQAHWQMVNHANVSPDGQWLASASDDGQVCVWNLKDRSLKKSIKVDEGIAYRVYFLADNQRLLVSHGDSDVGIWDAFTGKHLRTLKAGGWSVKKRMAVFQDRSMAAISTALNTIEIFSMEDLQLDKQLKIGNGHSANVLEVSADNLRLFVGYTNHEIIAWNIASGKRICSFKGHRDDLQAFSLHPDGNILASSDKSGVVRFWQLEKNSKDAKDIRSIWPRAAVLHNDRVWSIGFSANGEKLVSAGRDGKIKLAQPKSRKRIDFSDKANQGDAVWKNNRELFYSEMNQLWIWDVEKNERRQLITMASEINCLALHESQERLAVGMSSGRIAIIDANTHQQTRLLPGHSPMSVYDMAFGPNNSLLSTGGDRHAYCWDLTTGDQLVKTSAERDFDDIAFNEDENIAYLCYQNDILKWKIAENTRHVFLSGHQNTAECIAIESDEQRIATGSDDRRIKVWEMSTGKLKHSIEGHDFKISKIQFTQDQRSIIAGDDNGFISFSNVETGRLVMKYDIKRFWPHLASHFTEISEICVAPDGLKIALVVASQGIVLLEINSDPPVN